MAKIPLRVYNKEIDQLIENGQVAEAIAHCKHILKTFPKHIDTYRLLGQAYLTNQRYSEAADILQRVLSVIPDDFVSQIGMSIIREDEGNLDAAIYHMEKAFEVQPSKTAIQGELRRLYGRRDGMEPPKIRLTRGALVRMYLRGELYPQAIAEVRAALADDPQQLDLQVILAKLYDLSDQKVQAVEICSRLVNELPYCLEANRILAKVLPGTSRADDAAVFKERLQAIDPYEAFIQEGAKDSASVPDAAVQIERLEYNAAEDISEQPEWTRTAGVAWEEEETAPAATWMEESGGEAQAPGAETPAAPAEKAGEEGAAAAEIPAWMAAAGWSPTSGEAEETPGEDQESEETAAPGEIPEWLQNLAPEGANAEQAETAEASEEDETWLQKMMDQAPETVEAVEAAPAEGEAELPDWLKELEGESGGETAPENEPQGEEMLPDWLQGSGAAEQTVEELPEAGAEIPAEEGEALPDWLQELKAEEAEEIPQVEEGLPEWLQQVEPAGETEAEKTSQTEIGMPEMEAFPAEEEARPVEPAMPEAAAFEPAEPFAADTEEAVFKPAGEDENAAEENLPAAPNPEEDLESALAWLESLAAKQGVDEAELLTQPEQRGQEMPEWLKQEAQPVEEENQPAAEAGVEEAQVFEVSETEVERVEAVEEGLTAVEEVTAEAGQETPVTEAPEIEETKPVRVGGTLPPEAVEQSAVEELTVEMVEEPSEEEPAPVVEAAAEVLGEEEAEAPAMEEAAAAVAQAMEEPTAAETTEAEAAETAEAQKEAEMPEDIYSALAWLEGLAAKQGAEEETLLTSPESRLETPPEWVTAETTKAEAQAEEAETGMETQMESAAVEMQTNAAEEAADIQQAVSEAEVESAEGEEASVPEAAEGWTIEAAETAGGVEEALPDWLQNLEGGEATAASAEGEVLPEWLREMEAEAEEASGQPTAAGEWTPEGTAEEGSTAETAAAEDVSRMEEVETPTAQVGEETQPVPAAVTSSPLESATAVEGPTAPPVESGGELEQARKALEKDDIETALECYGVLTERGEQLEEIIHDLRDATYRYPVNSDIWQALGDAYRQSNHVQDALDAYTKAIELLR